MKIEPNLKNIKELSHPDPVDQPVSDVPKIGVWGIALVVAVLACLALCVVWFASNWVHISRLEEKQVATLWILATASVLFLLTLFGSRTGAFYAAGAVFGAQAGVTAASPTVSGDGTMHELREQLSSELGWRWRYRRPWLLLTGDDPTIGRILPDATAHRWLITDDAVLLWNKTGPDSRPDDDWLRELYKLRRNRPIDAVILVLDGSTDLTPQRRSTNAHSVTLSRIANVLHWSAPVYILDVAKTDELLDRVELAFAEGANHFWLDLQYYAFVAQEQAGGEYAPVRDLAATDCALMLERLPGFHLLSFSDGSPFADDSTLEWIARYATVRDIDRGETLIPVAAQSAHTDWAETEAKANDLATHEGLDSAFSWLQRLPAQDGDRDRFVRQMVMARVAERADRPDTALHLLSSVDTTARRFELTRWEPSLAFEAKQHLMRLLKVRMTRKDADKPALAQRIEMLTGELTAIDAARAVALD